LKEFPNEYFFVSNEVVVEIENRPRKFKFGYFINHILNSPISMDSNWKENRFLVKENGETRYITLNKVSNVDYGQISLAQNHPELTLVSNDRKLLKSAAHIIPGRVLGMPILIERLCDKYPDNKPLKSIKKTLGQTHELKSSLDKSKKRSIKG
jgi:hypothetical protein